MSGLPPEAAIHRDETLTPHEVQRQILAQISGWFAANYTLAQAAAGVKNVEPREPPAIWELSTPGEQAAEPPVPMTAQERSLARMGQFHG